MANITEEPTRGEPEKRDDNDEASTWGALDVVVNQVELIGMHAGRAHALIEALLDRLQREPGDEVAEDLAGMLREQVDHVRSSLRVILESQRRGA
jgi:hypothetical protein